MYTLASPKLQPGPHTLSLAPSRTYLPRRPHLLWPTHRTPKPRRRLETLGNQSITSQHENIQPPRRRRRRRRWATTWCGTASATATAASWPSTTAIAVSCVRLEICCSTLFCWWSGCGGSRRIETGIFCRNPYNVTGICNRSSCPLANSRYATIRDHDGESEFCCIVSPPTGMKKLHTWILCESGDSSIDSSILFFIVMPDSVTSEILFLGCHDNLTEVTYGA